MLICEPRRSHRQLDAGTGEKHAHDAEGLGEGLDGKRISRLNRCGEATGCMWKRGSQRFASGECTAEDCNKPRDPRDTRIALIVSGSISFRNGSQLVVSTGFPEERSNGQPIIG